MSIAELIKEAPTENFDHQNWKNFVIKVVKEKKDSFVVIIRSRLPNLYKFIDKTYDGVKFVEKLYNFCFSRFMCKTCGCNTAFISFSLGYRVFCRKQCARSHPSTIEKQKNTCILKYGTDSATKSPEVKSKYRSSMLKSYGSSSPFSADSVKKKIANSKIERGIWIDYDKQPEFKKYKHLVAKVTRCQTLDRLENYEKRGRSDLSVNPYHLDHKFSVYQGFVEKIPPEIIGNIVNLEFIPHKLNGSKQAKCSLNKEQLLSDYHKYLQRTSCSK